ncbi:MAG TPA: serine hydrolase domain-containing protein [Longimicrobium sp.]|nr:serine hydrolase domain-containing protein [Longimicrobium sp.]
MRRRHFALTLLLSAAALAGCAAPPAGMLASAPAAQAVARADTPRAAQALRGLLAAINSGDSARIARFAERTYDPGHLEGSGGTPRAVQRWMEVHTLYGPLEVDSIVDADSVRARAWLRGRVTRTWIDLLVFVDSAAPHLITRVGMGRGVRPPFADARRPRVSRAALPAHLEGVMREMVDAGYFSGSVAVWKDGAPVFEGAYGMADREAREPNTVRTRFSLASVGKVFTAVAALQLAQAGRLDLDAPVGRYVPSLPRQVGERVTARQLLEHSSGLGELGAGLDSAMALTRTVPEMVRLLTDTTLAFPPGTSFTYSNRGYLVLGAVIEAASGSDYYQYVEDHVFRPAGMEDTGFFPHDSTVARRAVPYTRYPGLRAGFTPGPALPSPARMDWRGGPAGGVHSTVRDLARFGDALLSGRLLSAESLAMMTRGRPEHPWGYGVDLTGHPGSFGHRGAEPGARAYVWIYPTSRTVVAVLSNDDAGATLAGEYLRDIVAQW